MEPLILYASERFIDEACRAFGVFVGKHLTNTVKGMGVRFKELSREEAKDALDHLVEGRSAETFKSFMSTGRLIKLAVLSFLWPPATLRKVSYLSASKPRAT
jgi:hypothetical protein